MHKGLALGAGTERPDLGLTMQYRKVGPWAHTNTKYIKARPWAHDAIQKGQTLGSKEMG